jgi:lipid-binding SYLF domain-containing protein
MKAMQRIFTVLSTLILLCFATSSVAKEDYETQAVLKQFQQAKQTQPFFFSSYGYAVFPSVGKGGFWVGGAYGTGNVYQANEMTGYAKLYQVSFGLQFGGQSYSEIIFFQDKRAYERFIGGSFELDAQASAVALTEGAQAKAGTGGVGAGTGDNYVDSGYVNGVAVFTSAKGGMMIEASIAGQKFSYEPLTSLTEQQNVTDLDTNKPAEKTDDSSTVIMGDAIEQP